MVGGIAFGDGNRWCDGQGRRDQEEGRKRRGEENEERKMTSREIKMRLG